MTSSSSLSVFSFSATMDDGKDTVSLTRYRNGKILIIVNTASRCSFSIANMDALCRVRERFPNDVEVLAFPCNQFAAQEPLTTYCELSTWASAAAARGAPFPIFDRVCVKGTKAHPLFAFLQTSLGAARWNYTKYVCDASGRPLRRFDSSDVGDDFEKFVETLVSEKKMQRL